MQSTDRRFSATAEKQKRSILSKLPESDYIVRNDILLNTEHGTSQIDHVVVSVYGIFVIETKNIRGVDIRRPIRR